MFFSEALIWLIEHGWLMFLHLSARSSFPKPLPPEEEQRLIEAMADGSEEAACRLIEHNLRLVAHIVKKYYADPSDQDDLISIGTIGLIKAVSSYRPDKGVRLATYAARCIENEILMHFRAGRKTQGEVSLDETQDADGDGSSLALLDMISVEDDRLHQVEMSDRYQKMYQCLDACLDHRERAILSLRYGLSGGEPMTQREIAAAQGISRSYVSRIEKKALAKLAAAMGE